MGEEKVHQPKDGVVGGETEEGPSHRRSAPACELMEEKEGGTYPSMTAPEGFMKGQRGKSGPSPPEWGRGKTMGKVKI